MRKHHLVYVPLPYAIYKNVPPKWLTAIADKFNMQHDGGGIMLGTDDYTHAFITARKRDAETFVKHLIEGGREAALHTPE